jgi:hypothetical protein
MESKYFSLGTVEKSKTVKIIRVSFGFFCFAIGVYWLIYNISSLKGDGTIWITIIFLLGFGLYQIWAGFGRATIFIEIGSGRIRLKKNPVLPVINVAAAEIEKIEMFPLNLVLLMKSKKKIFLRFGTTYYETNEKIKDEIVNFADINNIPLEIVEEKI